MTVTDSIAVAQLYQESRERIIALVSGADQETWNMPVTACPGWSVRDVVAHQAAVAEDWVSGRLTGTPTDEETAAQLVRFRGHDVEELLTAWTDAATQMDHQAEHPGVKPPVGDVTVHEHDIRSAIGRPGARDSAGVHYCADLLLTILRTPVPLTVTVEDARYRCGPDDGPELTLRTTRFEAVRWRTGRRSRAQLAAMDWSDDPTPVLDYLHLFGPAAADVIE